MQQAAKFWDNIAEKYAKSPIQDITSYEYTLERTKSYLSQDSHVLELGCGTGSTALCLAPHVQHITATDLSNNMIKIAKRKAEEQEVTNINLYASDLFDIDQEGGPYDAVLAFNLIHLLEDTSKIMQQISKLLKPNGVFISKTACKPNEALPIKLRFILMMLPVAQLFGKAPFVKLMKVSELEDHIMDAGFNIIETHASPSQPSSRYIVAKKPS